MPKVALQCAIPNVPFEVPPHAADVTRLALARGFGGLEAEYAHVDIR